MTKSDRRKIFLSYSKSKPKYDRNEFKPITKNLKAKIYDYQI